MCVTTIFPFFFIFLMKRTLTLFLLLLPTMFANVVMAVTAYPELVKFMQPDKCTSVMIYLKGDEKVHWAETEDGYSLVTDDKGFFVYATRDEMGNMVPSDFIATDIAQRDTRVTDFLRNTPKGLRYSKMQINAMLSIWEIKENFAADAQKTAGITGNRKILVILMGFQDKRFTTLRAMVRAMFNEVNYSAVGAYGSVRDYYYENSYGQLSLTADVVGPYVCDSNASFYGNNDNQSIGYQSFAREAIIAASSHVDFSNYDNDGDGIVDCIHILFAGYGEEAGGGADCIWSHKWNLFQPLTYNNTTIDKYSCSPEFGGSSGNSLTRIGVICHEIGHVFGAPDFYDTDYEQSGGQYPATGKWDLMAGGSWNMGGASPAHHNPYTKTKIYKWTNIKTLSSPSCITLNPTSSDSASYYRLNTQTAGEYYIIENRQQTGFDRGLPGHGMIVYHAHKDLDNGGAINTTHPQKFYVVSASSRVLYPSGTAASYPGIGTQECPFPGSTRNTVLNDTTKPSLLSWAGANSGHRLTYIGENTFDNTVSFVYNEGCTPMSSNFSGEGISGDKVLLSWTPFGSQKVLIVVNDTNNFSTPQNRRYHAGDTLPTGEIVVASDLFDIHTLCTKLQHSTTYYFRLYTMLSDTTYTQPLATTATTLCANKGFPFQEGFQSGEIPNCWVQTGQSGVSWQLERENHNLYLSLHADSTVVTGEKISQLQITPINLGDNANLVLLLDVRNILRYDTISDSVRVARLDTLVVKYRTPSLYEWTTLRVFANNIPDWQRFAIPLPNISDDYRIALEGHWGGKTLSVDNIKVINVHLVTVTTDGNGTIEPGGGSSMSSVSVPHGESVSFNIIPNSGYVLQEIYLDYVLQRRANPFVLNNVTDAHTIYATFAKNEDIVTAESVENKIVVSPNPATDRLHINFSGTNGDADYAIYDMSGRVMSKGTIHAGKAEEMDVSRFRSGVYYIKVTGDTFKANEKIIIKK